mgnify:FL=1|tara:strand:+ start:1971 stop:2360 length:390 start_codon:yes stop_codon:yes gene_type:complete
MTYDFHCWVVTPKGAICDSDTTRAELVEHYKMVSIIRHGHAEFEFVHKEWVYTPKPVLKMRDNYNDGLMYVETSQAWSVFKDAVGCCLQRALVITKRNKHCRIAYGSLGLKNKRTGDVWWEHGLGEKNK